jgi:hypothetical protein
LLGPLLQRQASIIARAQHLRTQSAEAKARGDAAAMRAVRAEIEQLACDCGEWAKEFAGLCVEQVDELLEIFPDNPVGIFSTVGKNPDEYATWFKPNRLYLDVTDGQLADVREVWSLVEHAQIQMTEQGHSRKRRRGARGLGKITTRWLARTQAVGQQQAYAEFVDEWKQRPEKYPAGYTAREWWHERIEPRLEKDRQI